MPRVRAAAHGSVALAQAGRRQLSRRRVHPVPTNLMRSSADVNVIGFTAGDFRRQPDPAVQVRRHDAVSDPLPQAAFDLVHARNLLIHLPARLEVLGRLLAAVRPGRWLAVCEPDFNAIAVTPWSAAWRRAWTVFCDAAISGGWDPGYGTRLVGDLEVLDLADLQVEVIARLVRGDSMGARLFADTLLRLEERMLALGARDDDLAETQRLLRDPTVTFRAPSTTIGWVVDRTDLSVGRRGRLGGVFDRSSGFGATGSIHRLAEVPRCSCCPWTASWRAQRRHSSNEAQCMTIDARLTVVAAESSLSYSGVIGPVTRVSPGDEGRASRLRDAEAAALARGSVGNGFGNETRRNCGDSVTCGVRAATGDSACPAPLRPGGRLGTATGS